MFDVNNVSESFEGFNFRCEVNQAQLIHILFSGVLIILIDIEFLTLNAEHVQKAARNRMEFYQSSSFFKHNLFRKSTGSSFWELTEFFV